MGPDLTFAVAVAAGLISFLSPCVLPLVPGYLGQLTAVAVTAGEGGPPTRWLALRHAVAYVAGFGVVFTLLGVAVLAWGVWRAATHAGLTGSAPRLLAVILVLTAWVNN